jgi:hypothetical protein
MKASSIKDTHLNEVFLPVLLRLGNEPDKQLYDSLLTNGEVHYHHDEIIGQLEELIKSNNPTIKIKKTEYPQLIEKHLNGRNLHEYGVWVYYPWSKRMVHLLDEEEFIEVRTNRNRYKITRAEQSVLQSKKIGIAGLSVGQSIALTMAIERCCGELRLADFDTAELSNLNRLRTGVHNLGLRKTIIAAREILEIDPYLSVKIFNDGLDAQNLDSFFLEGGKLDLFVEVCDGLDVKIAGRLKAKELKVPVVMDTNDRGMLDVERFDLEPERPILHGLIEGLSTDNLKDLTNEEKIPYILRMIGADTMSTRLKASMLEVEQSINTWPQLASSVTLGGALTTDVARRILLNLYHESGRYYLDMEDIVCNTKAEEKTAIPESYIGPPELTESEMLEALKRFTPKVESLILQSDEIKQIVEAGLLAPSGGNSQPWKLLYTTQGLFVFHDLHFSYSLLDFNNLGSYIGIGALVENIIIKASALGYGVIHEFFPVNNNKKLIAHIAFLREDVSKISAGLEPGLTIRTTNRELSQKETLSKNFYSQLSSSMQFYHGAQLHLIEDSTLMKDLGNLLSAAERLRILHPRGHYDTFTNELRWTEEEIKSKGDGLDINSLGATQSELAGFRIASDTSAIAFLRQLDGGTAFMKMVNKAVAVSSSLGIITMPQYSESAFLKGGRAVERIWIESNLAGVSFQPISQLIFLLARLAYGKETLEESYRAELEKLQQSLNNLLPELKNKQPVFMFRLAKGGEPKIRSLRRPLDSSFIYKPHL